jgi:hypothetical protein
MRFPYVFTTLIFPLIPALASWQIYEVSEEHTPQVESTRLFQNHLPSFLAVDETLIWHTFADTLPEL